MAEMKQWLCKKGHVLGLISWNGNETPQLMLYRHAIDLQAEEPEEVDVIGPLQGRMPVRCDVPDCDAVQLWEVSEQALIEMLSQLNQRKLDAVIERVKR